MYQTYELFDLRIFRGHEGVYPVEVLHSPAGEAAGEFTLSLSESELYDILERLEAGQADRSFLQAVGQQLYQMLFVPPIQRRFSESLSRLSDAQGLRVRLRVDPPELAPLPWEFLFDPQANEFLSLSPRAPLVRYVAAGAVEPLHIEAPVRLLLVVSNPSDAPPLDTQKEIALVQEALTPQIEAGHYLVDLLEGPTLHGLADKLREGYHILHYVGHAYLDADDGQSYLILVDEEGASLPVDTDALTALLKDTSLRLMVLNACESGRVGGRDAQLGLAPSFVVGGMPAVVAMQFPVPDRTAILLAREFYSALADNAPVDAAISEARKVIRAELGADSLDWGIPVLFMRAPDGHILEVKPPARPRGEALFSTRGWIAVGAVLAFALALLGIVAYTGLQSAGILPTPMPTLAAPQASENEFLVLVADFFSKDPQVEVPARLEPKIRAALKANQVPNTRVVAIPDRPAFAEQAIALAKRYNASMIVWGRYDALSFDPRVEVIDSPWLETIGQDRRLIAQTSQALGEVDSYAIAPETLRAYISSDLANSVDYLVSYTVGRIHYWQAVNLYEAEDPSAENEYQTALRLFSQAIAEVEKLPSADQAALGVEVLFFSRGYVYLDLWELLESETGSWELAAEDFKRAIEIKPDFAHAHYALGYIYHWWANDLEKALEQYRLAAETDKSPSRLVAALAYASTGLIYDSMENYAKAEANWRQALEINPDYVKALQNLGWYIDYLRLGNYEEAITLTQHAIDVNPDHEKPGTELELLCNVGLYYLAASNPVSATAVYDSATAFATAHPEYSVAEKLKICQQDLKDLLAQRPDLSGAATPILNILSDAESSLPTQEGSP